MVASPLMSNTITGRCVRREAHLVSSHVGLDPARVEGHHQNLLALQLQSKAAGEHVHGRLVTETSQVQLQIQLWSQTVRNTTETGPKGQKPAPNWKIIPSPPLSLELLTVVLSCLNCHEEPVTHVEDGRFVVSSQS